MRDKKGWLIPPDYIVTNQNKVYKFGAFVSLNTGWFGVQPADKKFSINDNNIVLYVYVKNKK